MDRFLLLIAAYLPFQLALNPVNGVDLASVRVLILVLFLIWLAEGLRKKRIEIQGGLQTSLVIIFLALNAFSVLVAHNPVWSLRKLLFLFSIFPLYFVAVSVLRERAQAVKIIKTLVTSGAMLATLGIFQFSAQFIFGLEKVYKFWAEVVIAPFLGQTFSQAVLQNPSWLVNISGQTYLRATAVFPDPHMLAFYLSLLLPWALMLWLEQPARKYYAVTSGLLLAGLVLTFSRGAYLGLFAMIVAGVIFFWRQASKKYQGAAILVGVLAVIILIIPNPFSARYLSSFNLNEGSNKGRIATWQKAGAIIAEHPGLGVGLGNYALAVNPLADYRDPIYAHSAYLDIMAETGVLNGLVWLGLVLNAILLFFRKARQDVFFLGGALGLLAFAIHSLVETAIFSPTVLSLFLLILALASVKQDVEKTV